MPVHDKNRRLPNRAQAAQATQQQQTQPSQQTSSSPVDASGVVARIDRSGLYDLQQVKRLLDDQLISVSCLLPPFAPLVLL